MSKKTLSINLPRKSIVKNARHGRYRKTFLQSRIQGEMAELKFRDIIQRGGSNITRSSLHANCFEHWDFNVKDNEGVICSGHSRYNLRNKGEEGEGTCMTTTPQSWNIDVKSMKRISRKENEVQDNYIWLELHGVRQGDKGWIYGGKADIIAFEVKEGFLLVLRSRLVQYVKNHVDMETHVKTPYEAVGKCYNRKNTADLLTLATKEDIKKISLGIVS